MANLFELNRNIDLVCLGRAGIDMNPCEFNKPLEEVEYYKVSVGGSPANIAFGVSKMGLKVGFIGKVSNDAVGFFVTKRMHDYGIDISHIRYDNRSKTSLAITEVQSGENCSVLFYRENAADLKLSCGDISEVYIKGASALLVSGTALSQSPSREAVYRAVDYAHKHGVAVIFEIDYREDNWAYKEETSHCYALLCEQSDVIIGTREEFNAVEYLYDRENNDDALSAKRWFAHRAKIVLIKRGANGSTAFTHDGGVYQQRAYPVEVQKTFGAGDAMAAGFIAALIKGNSVEKALQMGAGAASLCISGKDCSMSMPSEQEVEALIASL